MQAYQLGQYLRNLYLNPSSSSHIRGIHSDLVDLKEVAVRVKVGGEGAAVFDSATALLQGLFPPNPANRITLANETTVVAPLNGYQYVPVETVETSNDRSLEPWTDCPVCIPPLVMSCILIELRRHSRSTSKRLWPPRSLRPWLGRRSRS